MVSGDRKPPSQSLSGSNRYQVFCEPQGEHRNYWVCGHLVNAYATGVIKVDAEAKAEREGSCAYLMRARRCAAKRMRAEEIKKNKSIYFEAAPSTDELAAHSRQPVDKNSASYQRGWHQLSESQRREATQGAKKPQKKQRVRKTQRKRK